MLRCFQLQGHHLDAKFVEVGTEHVDVTFGTRAEPSGFKPLGAALAELLHNDSQAQERLQGKQPLLCIEQDVCCFRELSDSRHITTK